MSTDCLYDQRIKVLFNIHGLSRSAITKLLHAPLDVVQFESQPTVHIACDLFINVVQFLCESYDTHSVHLSLFWVIDLQFKLFYTFLEIKNSM